MKAGQRVRDFILEEKIGAGGVGEVWRARHQLLDKVYAIKVIFQHLSKDHRFQNRFLLEAVAMASLDHPSIVGVHNFFIDNQCTYLVMSFIEGESLEDLLHHKGSMPVQDAIEISHGILDALDFAHSKGVIHRDVKPSNIIIRPDGQACLVDFGIALVLGKPRVTQFGTNIGTPEYMSPEQIKAREVDHRTDVYSYGCVLYEMLSGSPPFGVQGEDLTDFDIMSGHVNTAPPSISASNPAVTAQVEAVIMHAMKKNPDDRFSGCREMSQALRETVEAQTVQHPGLLSRIRRLERKCKFLVLAVLLLSLSTVAAAGWVFHKNDTITGTTELRDRIKRQTAEIAMMQNENQKLAKDVDRYQRAYEANQDREKAMVHDFQREQFTNAVLLYALVKSNFRRIGYAQYHLDNLERGLQYNPSQQEKIIEAIHAERKKLAVLQKNSDADFRLYVLTVAGLARFDKQENETIANEVGQRFKKYELDEYNWIPKVNEHIHQARPSITAGQALTNERISNWRQEIRS